MNKTKLTEFKKRLIAERSTVRVCLAKLDSEERTLHESESNNPNLLAPVEVLEQITDRDENFLEKIDLALERIANNTYGVCVACGNEISHERLRAKPSASLCHDCQQKHENARKPSSDPTYSGSLQR